MEHIRQILIQTLVGNTFIRSLLVQFTYLDRSGWVLALAYHNAQLEAAAFREEYDPDTFEDLTEPNSKAIHRVRHHGLSFS